ncbi:vitamin B12 ABC transporter substrate-binding protein BtuF [Salinivibrio proteolyticus]|uniref:Vitamin B12 ABC transporter substrate-binding protein BtuF n=1 Tax=Salinivibrio proteolyticus TaxID=334715 RepID=A0ABY7LH50_9GAMM|nr:vitamin B12 ABC transporter substrate-binding protein BtuF [Salinivibrio proteolyticus]WBA15235.1 vitamin B12 ABC transporter substrate-binding protein BtuF [Salinivibrio proteolyticus]
MLGLSPRGVGLLVAAFLFTTAAYAHPAPPRVISLAPHATELAYAAGLGKQLVAASAYSDYPDEAKMLERVSNYRGIKLERIVALKPDLILAWRGGNPPKPLETLAQLGIEIRYLDVEKLDNISGFIRELGRYGRHPEIAQKNAAAFDQKLRALRTRYQDATSVPYFYLLSGAPLMTASDHAWPSQLFRLCGGANIFADSPAAYPQVNMEQVITRKPHTVFYTGGELPASWQSMKDLLPSLAQHYAFQLNPDWLTRATPRALQAATQICEALDTVRRAT